MIDKESRPVEWALLIAELDDAREHLEQLVDQMSENGHFEEEGFRVDLGHIYAHLNRAWHSRSRTSEIPESEWEAYSQFPTDLSPERSG